MLLDNFFITFTITTFLTTLTITKEAITIINTANVAINIHR